jgi:hypothetical protein
MLGASLFLGGGKNLQMESSFFKKRIFCGIYIYIIWFFSEKNYKLNSQERIATIIITIDYNFEETFKNMSRILVTLDALIALKKKLMLQT